MVLKITKPPRDKDSLSSLTKQGIVWMINVSFNHWRGNKLLLLNVLSLLSSSSP